jgi:hypothetical protein
LPEIASFVGDMGERRFVSRLKGEEKGDLRWVSSFQVGLFTA